MARFVGWDSRKARFSERIENEQDNARRRELLCCLINAAGGIRSYATICGLSEKTISNMKCGYSVVSDRALSKLGEVL